MFLKPFWLLFLAACLVGCAANPVSGPGAAARTPAFAYECDRELAFTALFNGQTVWLFLPDLSVNLARQPVSSGAKYQGSEYVFWSKGQEATLEFAGHSYHCRNNAARAVWESARLAGVDFRALGNEPGWLLEITGNTLFLTGDDGLWQQRFVVEEPEVDDRAGVARYSLPERRLEVLIERQVCEDGLSGEVFPARVRVTLDGRRWRGCGRALH
jgi:putative lipoprotein